MLRSHAIGAFSALPAEDAGRGIYDILPERCLYVDIAFLLLLPPSGWQDAGVTLAAVMKAPACC